MSHDPLRRLQHLFALARHGAERGLTDPTAIRVSFAEAILDGLDRRTFLQAAASLGAVGVLPTLSTGCGPGGTFEETDLVVVGGGIAGLHCAWRLVDAGVETTVYEANGRVGGRMWTARGKFADGQTCEYGGELVDTDHATLWALADELGVALDDRFAADPAEGFARDTWVADGVIVPDDDILAQFVAVAPKMAADVAAADSDEAAYAALDATTLRDWLDANVPTDTYAELHAVLESAYRGEYGLEIEEQSALNLLYLIGSDDVSTFRIFGASDERYHAHDGSDAFPTALARALGDARIRLGHRLTRVAKVGDGYLCTFDTADGAVVVRAAHVVFALPFSLLREVDLSDAGLSDEKLHVVDTLGYGTNAKVMLGFDRPVWREDHAAAGAITGDLPLQQTWDSSLGQAGDSAILTVFLGGRVGVEVGTGDPAGYADDNLPDLEAIWPGVSAAYTGKVLLAQWQKMPWSKGSYTCYRPGQWAFWGTEGAREGNLHFCGEHTSAEFQGWMEGGAETGALVAAEILDDLGVVPTARHREILDRKLVVPHPCYHAGQVRRTPGGRRARRFRLRLAARAAR